MKLSPSRDQISILLEYYQSGRSDDAEKLAKSLTTAFPDHQFSWKVLGILYKQSGRHSEALSACQTAISLSPDDAEAHNNLGSTLQELDRLDEATISLRKAVALNSEFVEAHYNLGITLQELGRFEEAEVAFRKALTLRPNYTECHNNLGIVLTNLDRIGEAESSYMKAISHNPSFAEAHCNLGIILLDLERFDEAEVSFKRAIALKPEFATAHYNLSVALLQLARPAEVLIACADALMLNPDYIEASVNLNVAMQNVKFTEAIPKLYPLLIDLLATENIIHPPNIADGILSLLKHDPLIKRIFIEKRVMIGLQDAIEVITALDQLPLLHNLMRICPLFDIDFERLFLTLRKILLLNLSDTEPSPELTHFLSTLALHCFTNEYVYFQTNDEIQLVNELEIKIKQTQVQSEQPKLYELLVFASYRPIHKYDWCDKLEVLNQVFDTKKRLIEEPLAERAIARDIPILGEISDDVSVMVREQYEENPYPRWIKLVTSSKTESIAEFCDGNNLRLDSNTIREVSCPSILVAGCGTGQHAIQTGSRFSNCRVIAVDLSLASLAYGKRQTSRLGSENIEYFHADILQLSELKQKFDIVESVGVLHHMAEPIVGWKILTNLLNPSGLMKIGLYSELARANIVKTRAKIASQKVGTSEDEIRKFRWSMIESDSDDVQKLAIFSDFFSLSDLRDLLFHVQEHRFTLPEIQQNLDELGLKFCGFEDEQVVSRFKEVYGQGADVYDLTLWHQFELMYTDTFTGMYNFWCQRL